MPATLLKKRLAQVLYCEFREISKSTFSAQHLRATASDGYNILALLDILPIL